jgi:hypothetical protein
MRAFRSLAPSSFDILGTMSVMAASRTAIRSCGRQMPVM